MRKEGKLTYRKKNKNDEIKNGDDLTQEQVWDTIAFARNYLSGMLGNYGNPFLSNDSLKNISFNPIGGTEDELNKALSDPKNNEKRIREFVEFLEILSMPFRRIISYQHSQLAFDLTWTVRNAKKEDYSKPSFKKEQDDVYNFIDNFDYRDFFRIALRQMLRNEAYICTPRQNGDSKIVLQELPLDRCKITGRWDYGLLIDFDFTYFLMPGVSIDMYHPWFKRRYAELYKDGKLSYNPAMPVMDRGENQYGLWVSLPPDVAWVFKFDTSIITQIPYYASLLPEFVNQPLIRALQKSQMMQAAVKILFGATPLLKDQKTTLKDALAISPETAGKFLALLKSALGENIKVATAPMEDVDLFSTESDNTQYREYLQTSISSSGSNTPLIFSGTQKANAIESMMSWYSDYLIMEKVYPQFNNFMNFFANGKGSKWKWDFEFEGSDYYPDRDRRLKVALDLADRGIVLPQKISAAIGIPYQKMIRMMDESDSMKFVDRLRPIQMASQMSAEAQIGKGRPQKETNELTDSGLETRDSGSNIEKGGSV